MSKLRLVSMLALASSIGVGSPVPDFTIRSDIGAGHHVPAGRAGHRAEQR